MRILGFTAYGGPEVLGELDVPDPSPGPGQVLIAMTAAGVNPADVKVRDGQRQGKVEVVFPMAVGREAAGVVVAVGEDVTEVRPGQLVFGSTVSGTGALGELVLLEAASTTPVPSGVTAEQAACIPVSIGTALDIMDEMALPPGSALLVVGAGGGVGTAACQLGRDRGLVVMGVASASKATVVQECGAVHVESGDGWADRARSLALQGYAGVIDCVGGDVLRDAAALRSDGAPLVSVAAPGVAAELGGGGATRRRTTAAFSAAAARIAEGRLTPVVSGTFTFAEALAAVAQVETGHTAGNVVVQGPGSAL